MQTPDEEINTLVALKDALDNQPTDLVLKSKIEDPSEAVDRTLLSFMEETFKSLKKDLDFSEALKAEILNRMSQGSINENQLISLLINEGTVNNDRISKILGPFVQLSVSKKNAEVAMMETNPNSANVFKKMNSETPKEVQQGLATLNMILSKIVPPQNRLINKPPEEEDERVMPSFEIPPDKELPVT